MSSDIVVYLNRETHKMGGSLVAAIEGLPAKLQKAPPKEWANTLKSLVSKGQVKQAEVDDIGIVPWMEMRGAKSYTRAELLKAIDDLGITIKEVTLGSPQYPSFSHKTAVGSGSRYAEVLFIANSQRDNIEDRLEEIDWDLEQFAFDIERLSEDPEMPARLAVERSLLMQQKLVSHDFKWSHFTRDDLGRHGKNLFAHARELVFGNTFLVEEIQSDWGQRGRMEEWRSIPKGPFVTDTKLWAGLAMRRMMQRAAENPAIERFYWIRGSMRNGGRQVTQDNLDEFYLKVMSGIVDRALSGTGQKCRLDTIKMGDFEAAEVPCFDMTPAVREKLLKTQPLYSLKNIVHGPRQYDPDQLTEYLAMAGHMIGSARGIRFVGHLYNVASGREVAGSYINSMVQVSLGASDVKAELDHECFHFGMDKLFSMSERRMVLTDFAPGTELNARVRDALMRMNEPAAARECENAEEAAAYAFSMWNKGTFSLAPSPVRGLFEEYRVMLGDAMAWLRRNVLAQEAGSVQELFQRFAGGEYACYATQAAEDLSRPAVFRSQTHRESA
ncbi:MAG: hypothetical protein Q7V53_03015 [Caldisericota bacterium]|nr:hypothetical protein [Caldisericota bacterium]